MVDTLMANTLMANTLMARLWWNAALTEHGFDGTRTLREIFIHDRIKAARIQEMIEVAEAGANPSG
jgi:hypothetical protein